MRRYAFTPPGPEERLKAIGPTNHLPEQLRRSLDPRGDFAPIPVPGPNDWLANHPEEGQTFEAFLHSRPNKPDANRRKLYLQSLGAFIPGESPSLERLKAFASAFFAMEVEVLPVLDLAASAVTTRENPHTHNRQLLTTDLLALLRQRLPRDAFALLGITMQDLYPDPAWNFVFGQASLRERVGVYSFARYDPRFYNEKTTGSAGLLLRRSCKVLAHEMAHMFGIQHCIYFHCLMNGSNHLAESDARPMHLCPVDLRKLQASIGFDVVQWHRGLLAATASSGFQDEAAWLERRLGLITGAG
jgi:archaemetzincin